jgi:hypothetical protein
MYYTFRYHTFKYTYMQIYTHFATTHLHASLSLLLHDSCLPAMGVFAQHPAPNRTSLWAENNSTGGPRAPIPVLLSRVAATYTTSTAEQCKSIRDDTTSSRYVGMRWSFHLVFPSRLRPDPHTHSWFSSPHRIFFLLSSSLSFFFPSPPPPPPPACHDRNRKRWRRARGRHKKPKRRCLA